MEKYIVTLTAEEVEQLQSLVGKGKHAAQKVINALILLNCDQSQGRDDRRTSQEIAQVLQVSERKIDRVKRRFVEDGLEVALSGQPSQREYVSKVDGDVEAYLIALSCSNPPEGHARWSLRLLADRAVELALGAGDFARDGAPSLKKNELKPWKKVGWVIAPEANAQFVANMERVLDVYRRPHDPAHPVVCMDETPRQLIGQTRQSIAAQPGKPEREDYEYQRLGVCNVFMACEPLAGSRLTKCWRRRQIEPPADRRLSQSKRVASGAKLEFWCAQSGSPQSRRMAQFNVGSNTVDIFRCPSARWSSL